MSSDDSKDKEAILRRRAFLVSRTFSQVLTATASQVLAATALTGCPQEPGPQLPATGSTTPVASVPSTDAGTLPAGSGSASVSPEPPRAEIPPLDVPGDVNDTAKGHFQDLARNVPLIHAELDAADKLARSLCDIEDAACDGTWSALAGHLAKARDMGYDLGARCTGSSDDAKRYDASLSRHRAAIGKRVDAIQARIDAVLDNDAKKTKWAGHSAKAAIPRPCLKYACDDW